MRRNAILGLYDAPIWKDWIAWLTLLALVAGAKTVSTSENGAAYVIDLVLALGFQFAIFGWLPSGVRRAIRKRRQHSD